jgi:hypothetical protein
MTVFPSLYDFLMSLRTDTGAMVSFLQIQCRNDNLPLVKDLFSISEDTLARLAMSLPGNRIRMRVRLDGV